MVPWRPGTEKLFFQALALGMALRKACRFAGVDFEAMHRRRTETRKDSRGRELDPPELLDPGFADRIEKALVQLEFQMAGRVKLAATKSWQAAAWTLERRFPEEYGRRARFEVTGEGGGPIPIKLDLDRTTADRLRGSSAAIDHINDALLAAEAEEARASARPADGAEQPSGVR